MTAPRLSVDRIQPRHVLWNVDVSVATITLNRPERKNPLTIACHAELTDIFRALGRVREIRAVVLTGAGDDFSSGGDAHEILAPLVRAREERRMEDLLAFTRMTGALVKAMRECPQPIVAAIDGVCAGTGAILAMASDIRLGTTRSRVAFPFVRLGLSGADMGACAILPRIIGLGRATELLFTGRFMSAEEAERWGFYHRIVAPDTLPTQALALARSLAAGPAFAHATTKACLFHEWTMSLDDALDYEARAQASCLQTVDFARAYESKLEREQLRFEGT
jgi:enoyl-CoA hydratase/carnithine racemase